MTDDVSGTTKAQFSTDLCGCCHNHAISSTLYAFLCPPCAMAASRSRVDDSNWLLNCCLATCFPNCAIGVFRSKVRETYDLEGNIVQDMLLGCCFPCCTTAQLLREYQVRGPPVNWMK